MNYEKITKALRDIDPYLQAVPIPMSLSGELVMDGVKYIVTYRMPGVRVVRNSQYWHGMHWVIHDFRRGESIEQMKLQIRKLDRSKLGVNGEIALAEEKRKQKLAKHRRELAEQAANDFHNSLTKTIL